MKKEWLFSFAYIIILFLCLPLAGENEKSSRTHSFNLVIREGFGSIAVGDLNTTLKSINSIYDGVRSYHPERCVGEIKEIPNNYVDWEVELQWTIGSGFIIGVAVSGPTRLHDRSFLTYTIVNYAGTQTENNTYDSEIKISPPIKLNVYRSFSIFPKVNLSINGGLGYYQARLIQSFTWVVRLPLDAHVIEITDFDVSGSRIGVHCGAQLEYKFNDRFSMLAEGQFNFSRVKHFSGTSCMTFQIFDEQGNFVNSWSLPTEGILYHYIGDDFSVGKRREKLIVSESPPELGYDLPSDVREAFLDLRGFALRIGLKIRLF
ncbi:MAG: hypothetical protein H5U06_02125 [Candidatus Aminicenantes bacterium]|nr:hypothetical protein [Candidatus Aminicenantes bacterium]